MKIQKTNQKLEQKRPTYLKNHILLGLKFQFKENFKKARNENQTKQKI